MSKCTRNIDAIETHDLRLEELVNEKILGLRYSMP
jgi:hypothetical protein